MWFINKYIFFKKVLLRLAMSSSPKSWRSSSRHSYCTHLKSTNTALFCFVSPFLWASSNDFLISGPWRATLCFRRPTCRVIAGGVLKISALGFLAHSFRFPSLCANSAVHVIAIFLLTQPRILFQPQPEEFSFLGFSLYCRCRIIFFNCSCWFLSFLFLTLTRKWELCLPL